MKNIYNDYVTEFVRGAAEDTVGLWNIIQCIRKNFAIEDETKLMEATAEFIRAMLAAGFKAGESEYSSTGYMPWDNQNPDQVVDRIKEEWQSLGRIPNIGEIAYFAL